MTDAGKQGERWGYAVWYPGGMAFGEGSLSLREALRGLGRLMRAGGTVRGEIRSPSFDGS